jgi:hypothetical protein
MQTSFVRSFFIVIIALFGINNVFADAITTAVSIGVNPNAMVADTLKKSPVIVQQLYCTLPMILSHIRDGIVMNMGTATTIYDFPQIAFVQIIYAGQTIPIRGNMLSAKILLLFILKDTVKEIMPIHPGHINCCCIKMG